MEAVLAGTSINEIKKRRDELEREIMDRLNTFATYYGVDIHHLSAQSHLFANGDERVDKVTIGLSI